MNKIICVILLFAVAFFCQAANFGDLNDDDAGQLLYYPGWETLFIFKKTVPEQNKWECEVFRSRRSFSKNVYQLHPGGFLVLNQTFDNLAPEYVAAEYAYWSSRRNGKAYVSAYDMIIKRMDSPATNNQIFFDSELKNNVKAALRDLDSYEKACKEVIENEKKNFGTQNSNSQSATEQVDQLFRNSFRHFLQKNSAVDMLKNIAEKDKNFFIAYCMYLKYETTMLRLLQRLPDKFYSEFRREILSLGEDICTKFVQERNYNQQRQDAFKKICGRKHGSWGFAPPTDRKSMDFMVRRCYAAIQKIQIYSPHSEFPDWGNAVLEVLQMIRNPELEKQFDNAFNEYQKYNSN